jgi:hypothetical protein
VQGRQLAEQVLNVWTDAGPLEQLTICRTRNSGGGGGGSDGDDGGDDGSGSESGKL